MGKKKISIDGLKKVMSPKEMQNVLGGSNWFDWVDNQNGSGGGGSGLYMYCVHEYTENGGIGVRETECFMSANFAIAFCQFYWALGYDCRCYSC